MTENQGAEDVFFVDQDALGAALVTHAGAEARPIPLVKRRDNEERIVIFASAWPKANRPEVRARALEPYTGLRPANARRVPMKTSSAS